MNERLPLAISDIEKKYSLSFENKEEEKLFFEMFNALLDSRIKQKSNTNLMRRYLKTYKKRTITNIIKRRMSNEFDITICLAALCKLNWPGKTHRYRNEIENLKKQYHDSPHLRESILEMLTYDTTIRFRNIHSKVTFFTSISDLIKILPYQY